MSYRRYLRRERETRKIGKILIQAAHGIKELHELGYVHRDLKPENIVLNTKPISTRIIDFNQANLITDKTVGGEKGTVGYYPAWRNVEHGSIAWDIWALGAIILESDMEADRYFSVKDERGSIGKAVSHLERKGVSKHLKEIVRRTVMAKDPRDMMTLDEIIIVLKKVEFMRY